MFLTSSLSASKTRAHVSSFESLPMANAFSQQLEELLNPLPKFQDPEDEADDATKAKVIERFQEDDDEDENVAALSTLRKNTSGLLETDRRYVGKKVSRKELLMDIEGSADSDDDNDDDNDDEHEYEEDSTEELADEGHSEEADVESVDNYLEDDDEMPGSDAPLNSAGLIFPRKVDFCKLTDGMDDLGVSEDDDITGEETADSDEDDGSDEGEAEDGDNAEDEGAVHTFSQDKADEEVEKGKAVKNQLTLWDQVLEGRIRIHKALVTANQLPQPQTYPDFKRSGGVKFASELKNAHKALKALQRSLLELQDQLLFQKEETRAIVLEETAVQSTDMEIKDDSQDEEDLKQVVGLPKRKLEMAEYPDFMAKRFAAFQSYQNATLQKWHDKTRLTAGKSSKGFGAFDRNILTQVEQVLLDRDRLVRRTQTQRSEYRILGKREALALTSEIITEGEEAERQLKANAHLKALDEDIFDDDDFYHQLLRELIEHKTTVADPNDQVAMGRQWLTIQKLRSKIKKKVDTKATKGRKVKFQIHNKLVNFMAPVDHSTLGDKGRTELYRGLFGQTSTARE